MLDAMAALREFVQDDVTLMALLGESTAPEDSDGKTWAAADRVVVNRLPRKLLEASDTYHPPKMIVLRHGGGPPKADLLPTEDLRVQVLCYGESDFQADRVRRQLWTLFVNADRKCFGGVLLHRINVAGGPVPLVDPDIVWPAMSQAFNLKADVEAA